MDFIHAREYLNEKQCIKVTCDTRCNVLLTDDINFQNYRNGNSFKYNGGFFKEFPAILIPPHPGYWNVTIDLGGASSNIQYSINVVSLP